MHWIKNQVFAVCICILYFSDDDLSTIDKGNDDRIDENGFPWVIVWMIMLQTADDDEEPPNYLQPPPLMQSGPSIIFIQ